MSAQEGHERQYFQSRLREELGRGERYARAFAVIVFEAMPIADDVPISRKIARGQNGLAACVRPSDVVARVFEDTLAALLVETGASEAQAALTRMRARLQGTGSWQIAIYLFPADAAAMQALPLFTAA